MGRHLNPIPSEGRHVTLPQTLWARVDLILFSPLEGRVPLGAMKSFIEAAIERELERLSKEGLRE